MHGREEAMAYDLEEQAQIEALKDWWRRYGTLVIALGAALVVSVAAFQGWRYYRASQSEVAAQLLEQLERAEQAADVKKVAAIARELKERYGWTGYAPLGALAAARAAFERGDRAAAKAELEWVVANARLEELRDVARLRLAGALLDEKDYAAALALLDAKHGDAMAGLYADLRGDILLAQGKEEEARSAYRLALDRSEPGSAYRATVQLKLDALGEPQPPQEAGR